MSHYNRGLNRVGEDIKPLRYYGAAVVGDDLMSVVHTSVDKDEIYQWYGNVTNLPYEPAKQPGGNYLAYAAIWDMQTGKKLEEYKDPNYGGPVPKPPRAPKDIVKVTEKPDKEKGGNGLKYGLIAAGAGLGLVMLTRKRKKRAKV